MKGPPLECEQRSLVPALLLDRRGKGEEKRTKGSFQLLRGGGGRIGRDGESHPHHDMGPASFSSMIVF